MIESQEHFLTNKKQHTEIKHKIFHDTFKSILGISAKFSQNNSFTYLDLYAGQGKFSDDSFGSPMLALNTILESEVINSFHQLKCFFSEIDKASYSELEKNISHLKLNKKLNPKVATHLHNGNWHEKNNDIENLLKFSKWGFIFVDPFSNEVNLNNLIELLQNHAKLQDFMIFINFQSLKRIIGRYPEHENTAKFLGVKKEELKKLITSNDLINKCIRSRFSDIAKDYLINISIPTTREGKIVEKDNFQLLLGTNSIGVSDAFLNSYFESLEEYKGNFITSLFDNIGDDIIKIIKDKKTISLNNIIQELYTNTNSWKYAEKNNIPTSDNIHRSINDLLKNKRVKIVNIPDEFLIKKNKTIHKKAYSRNKYMREIILE
ncbi:three-Cys-motif partner protein TcmP [Arcobacter cloacae]|uniref:Three-Cys-motif partner protein TcmP n=1 Tax=Arcobacter cloacae TaxID=1054034 RepID=A0A4Q0ZDR0_9BACT|nr:three-Cys-motif partner protein TcmP [Arcobacter cloacae]RXJ84082.1 hypothetical protein CRU90_06695 [Arcobacter cloacae]